MALLVGGVYVGVAVARDYSYMENLRYVIALIVAEFLVWFPDELGSVTGMRTAGGLKTVDKESPGCAVSLLGWVILIAIPVVHTALRDLRG
ncbi:MAG: hypothetical protein AAF488_05540 [Planctomycetota bacterium]